MPRWGGSHQQLYAFGRECLDTGRFDTNVPYYFLVAFEYIVRDIGANLDFYQTPGVYENLEAMADGYLAEPKKKWSHAWYRGLKVAATARCGKWKDARRFLESMNKDEPHENAFTRLGLKRDEAIGEIYARTGDLAVQNAKAEELAQAGSYDEAKAIYQELAKKTAEEKRVAQFFGNCVRGVEFDQSYAANKWTALPLDETLNDWRNMGGKWSVDKDGQLVGEALNNGLKLTFQRKLGVRFEFRGKVVLETKDRLPCNVGVYFGQENGLAPNSFRLFGHEGYAAVLKHEQPMERKDVAIEPTDTFRIIRWDNRVTGYLNDELIASAVEIEPYGPPATEVISLGGYYWYPGPIFRFTDLEVRKLETPPDTETAESPAAEATE